MKSVFAGMAKMALKSPLVFSLIGGAVVSAFIAFMGFWMSIRLFIEAQTGQPMDMDQYEVTGDELEMGRVVLFVSLCIAVLAAVLFSAGHWIADGLVTDAKGTKEAVRDAIAARTARIDAKVSRGGMLSMSVEDGVGGGLTQSAYEASGLELVEHGVVLDLEEGGRQDEVVEAERVEEQVR